ncbi:hypothetical protein [Isoptericola jiangsuensis]|uniref:hypothetical protein n=1 Tax=Isoptericola jiangsuensis TaxID=548579 RepID=UPI001472729A|nr:hypothetical protein [Isoptericola jiangsuensis]
MATDLDQQAVVADDEARLAVLAPLRSREVVRRPSCGRVRQGGGVDARGTCGCP